MEFVENGQPHGGSHKSSPQVAGVDEIWSCGGCHFRHIDGNQPLLSGLAVRHGHLGNREGMRDTIVLENVGYARAFLILIGKNEMNFMPQCCEGAAHFHHVNGVRRKRWDAGMSQVNNLHSDDCLPGPGADRVRSETKAFRPRTIRYWTYTRFGLSTTRL